MCKKDLDKIFNEYYERKKIEKKVSEAEKKEEQEKIEMIIDKLKKIVIPVLEAISKEIEKKGYKTSVLKRLEDFACPGVELKFLPIPKQEENSMHLSDSSISFIFSKSGNLTIESNIHFINDNNSEEHEGSGSNFGKEIENLTEDLVKTEVVKFIKKALKLN
jgi:hypothetical protein